MRLLLVEDDHMIGDTLRAALRLDGHAVDWVRDAAAAHGTLASERFDVVLLDLGLPKGDGLNDRVAGLDAGADDYLVKPFELDELNARIRAVVRRHSGRAQPQYSHGGVTLDPATRQVTKDGAPVLLSAREFAVLEALMQRPGALLSRAQLEDRLYGWGEEIESNAVSVYIHQLRRKLGADFIRNVRGVGYFVGEAKQG